MKHIATLQSGLNVEPLRWQLLQNKHLWNINTLRTSDVNSPHHKVDDIWVRYGKGNVSIDEPHESVWYDSARELSAANQLAFQVMQMVSGERLGGILITRVPPGGKVLPHVDKGWHANYYEKYAIQIDSNEDQHFGYEDGKHVTKPGDLYWFNNSKSHWVINDSKEARITLIICIRPLKLDII
jgi:hypothetical protein